MLSAALEKVTKVIVCCPRELSYVMTARRLGASPFTRVVRLRRFDPETCFWSGEQCTLPASDERDMTNAVKILDGTHSIATHPASAASVLIINISSSIDVTAARPPHSVNIIPAVAIQRLQYCRRCCCRCRCRPVVSDRYWSHQRSCRRLRAAHRHLCLSA